MHSIITYRGNEIPKDFNKSASLTFDDNTLLPVLFGEHNAHLHHLEDLLHIQIANRGNEITISGDTKPVSMAKNILSYLWRKTKEGRDITINEIDSAYRFLVNNKEQNKDMSKEKAPKRTKTKMPFDEKAGIKTYKNKLISPRSPNQAAYIDAIKHHDMVFGIGPAGTGKTFLAVASAVHMFQQGHVERMIFCRPAVEAGENLGFLPGDMREKIDPYLRPIMDALHEMMPGETINKKMENGDIEIAPLAYMRGRTLKNAFVVLDEAQNTTSMQMKMFLTRMGQGTHMIITGDPSQTDLPNHVESGLKEATRILNNVDDIPFIQFNAKDVVRHKLVTKIIKAYDKHDESKK
ncbi:MAG: phosphate starvation-inducible protein PhoH [Micavibrio sp.]|nr:phosphate starvation-inducible protein PhoH [Micavibrio sp.]